MTTEQLYQQAVAAIAHLVATPRVQVVDIYDPPPGRHHWRIRLVTSDVRTEPCGLHPDPQEALTRFIAAIKRYAECPVAD